MSLISSERIAIVANNMREIDCERNVLEKARIDIDGGGILHATIYGYYDVDQMLSCTPLTENEQEQHASGANYKGMNIRFSRHKISDSKHEYILSFGAGGTESKKRRVIRDFEERLGKVQKIESFKAVMTPNTDVIVGYLWNVSVA